MTREEAIKLLKQYQGYEPMSQDGETLKHAFDLTDETVDALLAALRPVSREQVERIRGEWKNFKPLIECQICGEIYNRYGENEGKPFDFCPACGNPMTDEAVDILFKRLEALNNAVD